MSIRKLDQEIQERIRRAMASLKSPDPDDYHGTAEREYQKELARILKKEGNKAANASTDQLIAGKLKSVGYGVHEIEEVIENHSPMAVKPTQEHRKTYAKTIINKIDSVPINQSPKSNNSKIIAKNKHNQSDKNIIRSEIETISDDSYLNKWQYLFPFSPSQIALNLFNINKDQIEVNFSCENFIGLCGLLELISSDTDHILGDFNEISQTVLFSLITQLIEKRPDDVERFIENIKNEELQNERALGWTFLLIESYVSPSDIKVALAEIFALNLQNIVIAESFLEWDDFIEDDVLLACEHKEIYGDFKVALTIEIQKQLLEIKKEAFENETEIVKKLSQLFHCSCLIVDPTTKLKNKDACLLINPDQVHALEVYLEPQKSNLEMDEYYIATNNTNAN